MQNILYTLNVSNTYVYLYIYSHYVIFKSCIFIYVHMSYPSCVCSLVPSRTHPKTVPGYDFLGTWPWKCARESETLCRHQSTKKKGCRESCLLFPLIHEPENPMLPWWSQFKTSQRQQRAQLAQCSTSTGYSASARGNLQKIWSHVPHLSCSGCWKRWWVLFTVKKS